jgi:hypothetical protein
MKPRLPETERLLAMMEEILAGQSEGFVFKVDDPNATSVKLEALRHRYPEFKSVHSRALQVPTSDGGNVVMFLAEEAKPQ